MWHPRFFGTLLAVLALLSFTESQVALAAYPTSLETSMSQPQDTRGLDGSFQLAVTGGSTVPLDMPPEKPAPKVQSVKPVVQPTVKPVKPAIEKPKVTPKKASKPRKKKVKKANVKKAPAKKPEKEEEGFLTKTFNQLVGSDDDGTDKKEAASPSQIQKTSGKKPEPEEKEGLLTKTLKSLVGGDEKKEQATEKNALNPINMAPTGSSIEKEEKAQPKTAKSETKKTLKDSFEKLIGVGAVKDEGDSKSAKTDVPAGETKAAKKEESGGLLDGILGGSDKKKDSLAKVEDGAAKKKSAPPAKPKKLAAKKYVADDEKGEEGQPSGNYGGAKKGKNLLKESFKTLITDDKKKAEGE